MLILEHPLLDATISSAASLRRLVLHSFIQTSSITMCPVDGISKRPLQPNLTIFLTCPNALFSHIPGHPSCTAMQLWPQKQLLIHWRPLSCTWCLPVVGFALNFSHLVVLPLQSATGHHPLSVIISSGVSFEPYMDGPWSHAKHWECGECGVRYYPTQFPYCSLATGR